MGIAFVLMAIFGVLTVAAAICAAVLGAGTFAYLRTSQAGHWRLVGLAAFFPFGCVLYAAFWFFCYAMLNDALMHHDPILGDSWYTDIGHGYAVDMIDLTDHGWLHPTDGEDNGQHDSGALGGVRRLQLAGPWIFGAQQTNWFANSGSGKSEDRFFAINTKDRALTLFDCEAQLESFAAAKGARLQLKPILDVYRDQRSYWFDLLAGAILLFCPAIALWRLVLYIRRVRLGQGPVDRVLPAAL